ncbi:MAG: APC family permease [Candidatus Longimicrobiales bacterium M2_2A_002]
MSELRRGLGVRDGAAVVVANVVGTGIFLTPAFIARQAPDPWVFVGLWVAGGVLAVIGAHAYAELAAMRPEAGGEYVYIREAFGPLAGFLSGWTSLVAGFSGAIAAAAVGFAVYLDRLVPGIGSTDPLLRLPLGLTDAAVSVTPRALVALGLITVFSAIHARGLRLGKVAQQALAALNVVTILALVVLGFVTGSGGPASADTAAAATTGGSAAAGVAGAAIEPGGLFVALVLVMFTYSGWNAAAYVAGELRDPGRTVPRSLFWGTGIVIVLYLALNALYVWVLGIAGIAGAEATGDRVAAVLWGATGTRFFTPLILLALASSVSAMVLTGPRVYFAMARDRCLPAAFGRLRDDDVPAFSIGAQAVWSAVLVLTGGFEALLTYTGFAIVLFAGLAVAALFVLRWRRPDARRPFRAWGYPWAPALFIAASVAMVVQSVLRAPGPSLAGVAVIGAGAPVFWWLRER